MVPKGPKRWHVRPTNVRTVALDHAGDIWAGEDHIVDIAAFGTYHEFMGGRAEVKHRTVAVLQVEAVG